VDQQSTSHPSGNGRNNPRSFLVTWKNRHGNSQWKFPFKAHNRRHAILRSLGRRAADGCTRAIWISVHRSVKAERIYSFSIEHPVLHMGMHISLVCATATVRAPSWLPNISESRRLKSPKSREMREWKLIPREQTSLLPQIIAKVASAFSRPRRRVVNAPAKAISARERSEDPACAR
jgi:hypothetical protein